MKNKLKSKITSRNKIKTSEHIFALKVKTESNGLGALKTIIVIALIALQAAILVASYLFMLAFFQWFLTLSIILTFVSCIHVLSSDYHGQAKATWVFFLLVAFAFGYIMYFLSDKRVLFRKSRKKYNKIIKKNFGLQEKSNLDQILDRDIKTNCQYLETAGNFKTHFNSKTTYYQSGASLFDEIIEQIDLANEFIFIEYFIISDGVLLNRLLNVLSKKAASGVDVRIIYDDMGSHGTLSRKTKKTILQAGIKLIAFNRLVPIFNIALNLRNHRKIVVIDGKVSFTGGANLADEYINEKRMHGYWKDSGIKIEGPATDNFTIAFLNEWQFLTNEKINFNKYLNKSQGYNTNGEICTPFVSGPNYSFSIAQNMYANQISNAKEKLYIMTPYFVPDETITNLIINKARSGVDVRIILPEIADKKFVYVVSRSNAEKLISHGIKLYTMKSSFVHSKVVFTESSAIVGSINIDLRSFNQQFESAVFLNQKSTLSAIESDFEYTFSRSLEITDKNKRRNYLHYRILSGLFTLISPFM